MLTASSLIEKYNLAPHPEGGYYLQSYKSTEEILATALPARFTGKRTFSTAIYFLLEKGSFSAFHRIKSDECWHFYAGESLLIYTLQTNGTLTTTRLGPHLQEGETFQHVVPANCWFASEPAPSSSFSFVGCTVAPGFEYEDFEIAKATELVALYPQHTALIHRLCR